MALHAYPVHNPPTGAGVEDWLSQLLEQKPGFIRGDNRSEVPIDQEDYDTNQDIVPHRGMRQDQRISDVNTAANLVPSGDANTSIEEILAPILQSMSQEELAIPETASVASGQPYRDPGEDPSTQQQFPRPPIRPALSYYEQISDVGRDQKMTERALAALKDVTRRYPDSKYPPTVENAITSFSPKDTNTSPISEESLMERMVRFLSPSSSSGSNSEIPPPSPPTPISPNPQELDIGLFPFDPNQVDAQQIRPNATKEFDAVPLRPTASLNPNQIDPLPANSGEYSLTRPASRVPQGFDALKSGALHGDVTAAPPGAQPSGDPFSSAFVKAIMAKLRALYMRGHYD
jgi:hypothetical protein